MAENVIQKLEIVADDYPIQVTWIPMRGGHLGSSMVSCDESLLRVTSKHCEWPGMAKPPSWAIHRRPDGWVTLFLAPHVETKTAS